MRPLIRLRRAGRVSGLGTATVDALARACAHVVLAVRNPGRGEAAAATVKGVRGTLEVRRLDAADLSTIRDFATAWQGDLDILINNAGVMNTPESTTWLTDVWGATAVHCFPQEILSDSLSDLDAREFTSTVGFSCVTGFPELDTTRLADTGLHLVAEPVGQVVAMVRLYYWWFATDWSVEDTETDVRHWPLGDAFRARPGESGSLRSACDVHTRCTTTTPGSNCCPWSWGSTRAGPVGGRCSSGRRDRAIRRRGPGHGNAVTGALGSTTAEDADRR
ncbi:SDR family NAD(P)-dependent oxidoreductase [Streptomyces sp. AS02]|uniref:SDR family NAD(P)-dependent oxidoreductase n=1 Tax=Streptomyces sp. AS02 TaxID=2938946 RepID=UPI0020204D53|nr:SDR family NAD(P)-dependent oxidoreductase [Streptomyces sp. AS02]MCL8017993.1 SDR family NAD(P)-dependent oxidoreductase [Streptomyces sp. AS02]